MKKILLFILLLGGFSLAPTVEAGIVKEARKFLEKAGETSLAIAHRAIEGAATVASEPVVWIGGPGLILSTIAGIGYMAGSGLCLQANLVSDILSNQITRASLGKSALGLALMGTAYLTGAAAKNAYDRLK